MKKLILLAVLISVPVLAQDTTHPRNMGLSADGYTRPDPVEFQLVLENGLIAYVAESGHVPLVTLSAFIRAGRVSDEKQGAAEVLEDAFKNIGPSGMGPDAFRQALSAMTAELTVAMHDEWTELSLNVPTEDLDEALPLFVRLVRNPAIVAESVERVARGAASEAVDLGGESGAVLYEGSMNAAVDHFYDIIYDGHPFGDRPMTEDFEALTVADVTRFFERYVVPGNVTLAVAGDLDVDDINNRLASLFSDWSGSDIPDVKRMPAVEPNAATTHHLVSNKLQSWLVVGNDLPPIPMEEQAAFDVMNYIIGDYHMNTRLMRNTRYKYGWTNDASSFAEDRWYGPGGYTFRSYSRPEVVEDIYDNIMEQLMLTRDEPVSDQEMFVAKGAITAGHFQVRYLDGYVMTRSFALERLRYGTHERSASYVERVNTVTKKDVQASAQKYIRPEHMQVVLLGEEAFDID